MEDNTDCQDSVKGDIDCLNKVKTTVIMGNKLQDFDNWLLNTALLNTGSTVIGMLKNTHTVLKTKPLKIETEQKFYFCGQIC